MGLDFFKMRVLNKVKNYNLFNYPVVVHDEEEGGVIHPIAAGVVGADQLGQSFLNR